MTTSHDPNLQKLFTQAEQDFRGDSFAEDVLKRIDRERRKTLLVWSVLIVLALAGLALLASPVFTAIGTKPKAATNVVIRMGRRRVRALCSMAWSSEPPLLRMRLIVETRTSPASIATPETATNPTPAETVYGMPRIHNAKMPPSVAKGAPVKMMRSSRAEFVLV